MKYFFLHIPIQFEERKYQGGKHWVSHKKTIKKSEMKKSDSELFMSLFNYITGKNETGKVSHQ